MGNQIIQQPNGQFAIFSNNTDTIHVYNATADEHTRRIVGVQLARVAAGEPKIYGSDGDD